MAVVFLLISWKETDLSKAKQQIRIHMKITEFKCICMSDCHVVCFFRDGAETFFGQTSSGISFGQSLYKMKLSSEF